MQQFLRNAAGLMIVTVLAGCSYSASPEISPAYNVYSSYDDKLSGRYFLFVQSEEFADRVKPTGYQCSAHSYPIDANEPFKKSVLKTIEQVVEHVELVETPKSASQIVGSGYAGQIRVNAEDLDGRIKFIPGFWSNTAETEVELVAGVKVDGPEGRLLGMTVVGDAKEEGDQGVACGGGAEALATATEKAMKELLTQLGEKLSNSDRLRQSSN